jgi:hypothetical protein
MTPARLHVRAIRLRVQTGDGEFGADVKFETGLNVLEARNSMGKSICIQSILYALGMEGMLGPRHDVPLPDAMTDRLETPDGTTTDVRESRVWLEVEGIEGRVATFARWAKHKTIDPHLVTVWDGPVLTDGGAFREHDHLVRMQGVDREVGLHNFLKAFMGWAPPEILRTDGTAVPLYLEYVFPLLFVEQRGGWSGIQAQEPSFFVPEAKRRAIEFLLDLHLYERMKARLELNQTAQAVRSEWHAQLERLSDRVSGTGFVLTGVPTDPVESWPPESAPGAVDAESEEDLNSEMGKLRERLERVVAEVEETPEGTDQEVTDELQSLRDQLPILAIATADIESDLAAERETNATLVRTLASLERDLERNTDAARLRDLGSENWAAERADCPTCHRPLDDVVLSAGDHPVMTLEDNIAYIKAEMTTFGLLGQETQQRIAVRQEQLNAHSRQLREMRHRIRELRTTAIGAENAPSAALIGERMRLEARIEELASLETDLHEMFERLEGLSSRWREVSASLAELPKEEITPAEQQKLDGLRDRLVEQLEQYEFKSGSPSEIELSPVSYHPARDGAEISWGISASDGIRMVWAYLLGLLEVARVQETNHPGLVIFDEPRQQSAERASLDAFLERASASRDHNQQVILATSEEPDQLQHALENVPHAYHQLPDRLLRPV